MLCQPSIITTVERHVKLFLLSSCTVGDILSDYCQDCQSWHCKRLPGPESAEGQAHPHLSQSPGLPDPGRLTTTNYSTIPLMVAKFYFYSKIKWRM